MIITAVVVRAGVAKVENISDDLATMHGLVGGDIEHVTLRGPWAGLSMWVNETGMLDGLPQRQTPFYPAPIAGDYFLTSLEPGGETDGLSLDQVAKVLAVLQ